MTQMIQENIIIKSIGNTAVVNGSNKETFVDYGEEMSRLYDWVANESVQHKHCMGYNLKLACGNVTGKKVLEAACGNGAYMQYLYDNGAAFVAGVDLSEDNLDVCRANHAGKIPTDAVSYTAADLSVPAKYEGSPFDMVLMGCCICYASNEEQLRGWCQNAYDNLKTGGKLICINTRGALPAAAQEELQKLNGVIYLEEPERGSASFSQAYCEFPNGWKTEYIFILPETIEQAMKLVGFTVEKLPMQADPEYKGGANLQRIVELAPYDLFVALKL